MNDENIVLYNIYKLAIIIIKNDIVHVMYLNLTFKIVIKTNGCHIR